MISLCWTKTHLFCQAF